MRAKRVLGGRRNARPDERLYCCAGGYGRDARLPETNSDVCVLSTIVRQQVPSARLQVNLDSECQSTALERLMPI